MAMNFVSICYEYHYFSFCSVWTITSQSSCDVFRTLWALCMKCFKLMKNLCTRLHSSKVATTLLQPWNFHMRLYFYTGKIDIQFINTVCMALEEPIKNTVYSICKTICNAILCEVNQQNTCLFLGLLAIRAVNQFYG